MNNWLRAIAFLPFLGLSACGGGGGSSSPPNTAPTANFDFACSGLACTFTSTSSDQDQGDGVVLDLYNWNFGDMSTPVTKEKELTHTFPSGGKYVVTLKVGDNFGNSDTEVKEITVTPSDPAGPRANFIASCVSLDCVFTDKSDYLPSVVQSRVWDFGDNSAPATAASVSHKYSDTSKEYTVKLTVTDAAGNSSSASQLVTVSLPATTLLTLTQASSVTATIVSQSCTARGNQVRITAPVVQTVFDDGCYENPIGVAVPIDNGGNKFAANTTLEVTVLSGLSGTSGLVFPPTIRVAGNFANGWTLSFDDGSGGSGEPDFNDLVILIKATP